LPATRNLTIYQGDVYDHEVTFTDENDDPIDMSAATWRAQLRRNFTSASVLASFTIDDSDAATGVVRFHLTKTQTADLPGAAVWDAEDTTLGVTYLRGTVVATREVSRS
jgi:hypothetical protein